MQLCCTVRSSFVSISEIRVANLSLPCNYFRFGVLQLRVGRFETLHLEVITSAVQYLSILQDSVCALFIVQAKVVRIALYVTMFKISI
jgi:hypothetical protein